MAPIRVERYVVGSVQTNCYFAINDDTGALLIIDPGANADQLIEIIEREKLNPDAILLTHGHFDHAKGAAGLAEHFQIEIYAEEHEKETLENPTVNLSGWDGKDEGYHATQYLRDGQELDLGGFHIRALYTPGHTVGGCCYLFPCQKVLFSGDTLFQMSIGRTDFPGGNTQQLLRSIREKLMTLPDDIVVYAGHEDATTIGEERMHNPYF